MKAVRITVSVLLFSLAVLFPPYYYEAVQANVSSDLAMQQLDLTPHGDEVASQRRLYHHYKDIPPYAVAALCGLGVLGLLRREIDLFFEAFGR